MHQTKKGNQWHFWHEGPDGVDAKSGLTHNLVTLRPAEHDLNRLGNLLHGEGNLSQPVVPMPRRDATARGWPRWIVDWLIMAPRQVEQRSSIHARTKRPSTSNTKASIRAKVEHRFASKRRFGFVKARYKGFEKR